MKMKTIFCVSVAIFSLAGCKQKSNVADQGELTASGNFQDGAEAQLNCKPATGMFSFLAAVGVYDAWDDRPVKPLTIAKFTALDGKALPIRLIYRFAGQDFEMPVADDGGLILEYSALDPDEGGELCVLDPARAGDAPGGLDLGINTEFVFKQSLEGYSFETLETGAALTTEYTSRIIRQNTGADIDPVLGKANWLIVRQPLGSESDWNAPKNVFMNGDKVVSPPPMEKGEGYIQFSIADAREQGADRWVISGKDYLLSAIFDPNKVPENYREMLGVK